MTSVQGKLARIVRSTQRRGVRETGRIIRNVAVLRVRLDATHLWYVMDVASDRPRRELAGGLRFVRAGVDDLERLADLDTITPESGGERLADGADLWLVLDEDDRTAFACWTFTRSTPHIAARSGWLDLPAGVASLEDSITSPDHRGRGIAPAAWTLVADAVRERGERRLITIVDEENQASRRAVLKAGFGAFAVTGVHRRGPKAWTEIWTTNDPLGADVAARLPASHASGPVPPSLAEDAG